MQYWFKIQVKFLRSILAKIELITQQHAVAQLSGVRPKSGVLGRIAGGSGGALTMADSKGTAVTTTKPWRCWHISLAAAGCQPPSKRGDGNAVDSISQSLSLPHTLGWIVLDPKSQRQIWLCNFVLYVEFARHDVTECDYDYKGNTYHAVQR